MEDVVGAGASPRPDPGFWNGRRVFLTGQTGFKGAWAALWLESMGAEVTALALAPAGEPNLYTLLKPSSSYRSIIGDIRDMGAVRAAVAEARPSVALHMAAQPLVRKSYRQPAETFASNVQGTVHVLEALREAEGLEAVLCITTDKVYRNDDQGRAFVEDDPLGGHDPYSASKAAAELAIASWADSFFAPKGVPVASARAGNVVGGGDWSEDRLAPDLWRAAQAGEAVVLRYPEATRPWQHVMDSLCGYLLYLERLVQAPNGLARALNFGPDHADEAPVSAVAERMAARLGSKPWVRDGGVHPPEMKRLSLDNRRAYDSLGWRPRLSGLEAIDWTVEWLAALGMGRDARALTLEQIERHQSLPGLAPVAAANQSVSA